MDEARRRLKVTRHDVGREALAAGFRTFPPDAQRVVAWWAPIGRDDATGPAERHARRAQAGTLAVALAAATTGLPADALGLTHDTGGRPRLGGARSTAFSLAHTGPRMMLALGSRTLGVDAERERPRDYAALARQSLTDAEHEWFARQPDATLAFLRLWTAKEALLKAAALGLAGGLRSAGVVPRAEGGLRIERVPAPLGDAQGWQIVELVPEAGYLAAIACAASVREIDLFVLGPSPSPAPQGRVGEG